MFEGMLWFDNSEQRDLPAKIERAATFYKSRRGVRPTLCFVHPEMLPNGSFVSNGIEVRSSKSVLMNHFWIGAL